MKKRNIICLFIFLFSCVSVLVSCENSGTSGLKFLPLNDKECAVTVGDAKLLKEIVIPSK